MLQHYHKSADKLPSNVPAVTRTRKTARKYNKGGNPITLSLINNSRINCTSLYVNVVISDLVFLTFLFTVDVRNELPLCLFISHPQICIYSDCAARFILQQSDGATQPTQCNRVWFISGSWCFLVTAWSVVHWNTSPSITAHMNADINLMQTTVVVSLHFVNGISELWNRVNYFNLKWVCLKPT